MTETYSTIWVAFFVLVITQYGSGVEKNDDDFQTEYVSDFKGMVKGSWSQWDPKFTFEEKELDDLCARGQKYAKLDGKNSGAESYKPFYNSNQFVNLHYKRLPHIKCRTIPPSYIRLVGESNKKNIVVMQTNRFIVGSPYKFQFHLSKIKSEPILCADSLKNEMKNLIGVDQEEYAKIVRSTCYENSKLLKNYFHQLQRADRLHLCFAAIDAIRRLNPRGNNVPGALQSENVKKAQIFEVQHGRIGKQKYVLLPCPSSPSMYVGQHLKKSIETSNVIQVLLVTSTNDGVEQL